MHKRRLLFVAFLLVISAVLAACGQEPQVIEVTRVVTETDVVEGEPMEVTRVVTEEVAVEVTRVVVEEVMPTPVPVDRNGAWVDTVVVVEEPNPDAAITRLEAGDIDVYAFTIASPGTFQRILDSEQLSYKASYGSYNELSFNPAVCTDATKLNPFVSTKIREAMNWLVDRDYIVAEISGGLGTPRYVPINGASADRARLAAEIRAIEAKYAYNPDQAQQVIAAEMEALGATQVDGQWTYNGAPVELTALIRTEDERTQIGDYVANQLENIGFTVIRDYKTAAEASPIWLSGEPTECLFNFYTGGWISTAISRDEGSNFLFFYTPSGLPRPLWQAYTPTEAFATVSQRLNDNDFTTFEERIQLFAEALPLALEDSVRVWLMDRTSAAPYRSEVEVSADLSGSIYGSVLWPYTLRRSGEVGGSITWASSSILTEAWNPIAGTNWIYDTALIRATGEQSFVVDPNTGLTWPNRMASYDVVVQEGLPVSKTLDWLTLEFAPEIVVPDDAWADWDAASQTFLTAADVYTETQTALTKITTTYPSDLFDTVTWHDGSPLSLGDMIMLFILQFDQAKPESAIFDEAQVPALDSFMQTFKGLRITSTDPLTVEFYTDLWSLDAETSISNLRTLWPYYGFGQGAWHTVGLGVTAESKGLAVFSADKSTALEVEQLNYISGPTLDIMTQELTEAAATNALPYAPTLSQYISTEEAAARYANLQEWFRRRGHYWVGTGPFYLQRAFPVEGTVILQRNENYPDPADKWARFSEPAIAQVEIDGPGRVAIGEEAAFDVFVDFNEAPYPMADIQEVKYLVFDATGALASTGVAEAAEDGLWTVTLAADMTSALAAGSNRLEVVVVSKLVALPSLGSYQFVTAP